MFDFLKRNKRTEHIEIDSPEKAIFFLQICFEKMRFSDIIKMSDEIESLNLPDDYLELWR